MERLRQSAKDSFCQLLPRDAVKRRFSIARYLRAPHSTISGLSASMSPGVAVDLKPYSAAVATA